MYSSVEDVRNALTPGADSDDASTAAGLEDEQLNDSISEADAIIDAWIAGTVKIPSVIDDDHPDGVAPYPVRYYSRNIAAWLATLTFKRNKDVPPDDPVRLRYIETMKLLERIASGDFVLPNPPFEPTDDGGAGGGEVFNQYEGTLFGPSDFNLGYGGSRRSQVHDFGWNV